MLQLTRLAYLLVAVTAHAVNVADALAGNNTTSATSAAARSSRVLNSSIPKPTTITNSKRSVVLPQDKHSDRHVVHTHPDPWHQWEGLVAALVAMHIVALAFWCYLLYVSRDGKKKGGKRPGAVSSLASTFGSREGSGAGGRSTEWRSPREILSAYNKQLLGKV
ncbi:MAG: hypothetical protein WDW38_006045 [Sanguina aurantia]